MSTGNDPVRLIADPGCPESQRTLLRLGADIAPPRDAEARVWTALAGALGGAAVAAGMAVDASTKTITTATDAKAGLLSLKVVALTAALTALGVLGIAVLVATRNARPPAGAAPVPAVEAPPRALTSPRAPTQTATQPPTPTPTPAPAPAPRGAVAPPARVAAPTYPGAHRALGSPARRLGEETTLIRDARQALRAGNATRALRLLEEARQLFPAGVLQQERERLAIEALVKDGRRADASARAAAFLRRYPDSPHASEIRALGLDTPGRR
jgi:hypothetical protein